MSGIFGQTAKFGQRPSLFHISNIGIKSKLTKQTVKILMRRAVSSGFTLFANVCPNLPDVRIYQTLPYSERQKTFLSDCFNIKFKQAATSTSWNIETLHVVS